MALSGDHMGDKWEARIPAALNEIGALIRDEYRRIPALQRDLPCLRCLVDVHAATRHASEEPEILRTYLVTPDIWREITPRPRPSNATCGGYLITARASISPFEDRLNIAMQFVPGRTQTYRL